MNEFVEQCRREWRRLHVPAPVADEMAAELAADLEQAHAEGASPEDVLGSSAADPRSFAAAWAAERGVTPPASGPRANRALTFAVLAILATLAVVGAVLVSVADSASPALQALPSSLDQSQRHAVWIAEPISNGPAAILPHGAVLQPGSSDDHRRTLGLVLLIVGLAGIVPLAVFAASRNARVPARLP